VDGSDRARQPGFLKLRPQLPEPVDQSLQLDELQRRLVLFA
jgi:hypothetical protein